MIDRAYDIFEDESEDVYCEIKPCKKQRVKRWCFVCLGCTIKYEAKNKSKFNSCCGGSDVNFTFTNKVKFHNTWTSIANVASTSQTDIMRWS